MPSRLVVADTGPLNYLVLIEAVDVLPKLFEQILVPAAVYDELTHADSPDPVRAFVSQRPAWLEVRANPEPTNDDAADSALDAGERAAIALATSIRADLILMDDRAGVAAAYRRGLVVTGTLGVLDLAADVGFSTSSRLSRGSASQISAIRPRSWKRCSRNSDPRNDGTCQRHDGASQTGRT